MNRLFIEFYLDEDVSILVADLIRARGFVITTRVRRAREAAVTRSSWPTLLSGARPW